MIEIVRELTQLNNLNVDKSHNVIQRFYFRSLSLKTYMMSGWNFLNFELSYGCDVLIFTVEKICIKNENGKVLIQAK